MSNDSDDLQSSVIVYFVAPRVIRRLVDYPMSKVNTIVKIARRTSGLVQGFLTILAIVRIVGVC